MVTDPAKVRPIGPWVLLKVDQPPEKSAGGIFLPKGNLPERLGHATATVLRVGSGQWKKGKRIPCGLDPGDRVMLRGYLKDLINPGGLLDRDHCLIHCQDIVLCVEDE